MQITIISGDSIISLEVSGDMELENFIALCQMEIPPLASTPLNQLRLSFNGVALSPNSSDVRNELQTFGVKDGDVISLESAPRQPSQPPVSQPASIPSAALVPSTSTSASSTGSPADVSALIANLVKGIKVPAAPVCKEERSRLQAQKIFHSLQAPGRIDALRSFSSKLADTYEKNPGNFEAFHAAFVKNQKQELRRVQLMHDETSAEGQRYIAELIARQNIDFTHQFAMEHMPEAFIPVHMLYIRMKINNQPVIAFVDSGAQVSILSESCAKRCNVFRLLDERYRATAMGVGGSKKFLGRIHSCQVQVEGHVFPCPFDVMADQNIDILLGLNTLRRHQCSIDLQRNVLRFGDGTETPFLSEEEYKREVSIEEQAELDPTILEQALKQQ